MSAVRAMAARLRGVFSRRRERELDEEMQLHLDLLAQEHKDAGQSASDAVASASRAFGARALVRDRWRDQARWPTVDALLRDLRRAVRALVRTPTTTLTIVLTLGIGVGASTAIFSVVDGVLLRRAPIDDFDRLVVVWESDRNTGTLREPGSVPDYRDYATQSQRVQPLAAIVGTTMTVSATGRNPRHLGALQVSADALGLFGVQPTTGRLFTPEEHERDVPVAIISESLWSTVFNRHREVVGSTAMVNGVPTAIVGVVPDASDFGVRQILAASAYGGAFADRRDSTRVDLWVPLPRALKDLPRSTHPVFMIGRLSPGTAVPQAQDELAAIAATLERTYSANAARCVFVEPLAEVVFGGLRPALVLVLVAAGFVLIVACVNVVNVLLARGIQRGREVAVQSALGARRLDVARQFLVESALLVAAGAMLGVVVASVSLHMLLALAPPGVPRLDAIGLDGRVLATTLAVSGVISLVCGLVPARQAWSIRVAPALHAGGSWATRRDGAKLQALLVVAELALSVMLLVGASLLLRSLWRVHGVDPGFDAAHVLKVEYVLPRTRYPADPRAFPHFKEAHAFTVTLLERVSRLPGVKSAAVAANHPLDRGFTNSFVIVGREAEARTWPEISIRRVTADYFESVGLRLVSGRRIQTTDVSTAPAVALVNEAVVRRFFADRNPIGAVMGFWGTSRRIVGIVADERTRGVDAVAPIAVYVPLMQAPSFGGEGTLLVRTDGDPRAYADATLRTLREIDPEIPAFGVEALGDTLWRSLADRRFTAVLVASFAVAALVLAAVGINGVFRYNVERRTREVGVRLALGARPGEAVGPLVREGLRLIAAGLVVGVGGAWLVSHSLRALLFEVSPTDPAAIASVACVTVGVAVGATLLAVRRILRVPATLALRAE